MLSVQKNGENRIDLTLDGKLDDTEMMAGLEALIKCLDGVENGVMFYRIRNFTMPSFGALTAEIMNLPSIWRMLKRIDRCAVVSDIGWIRMVCDLRRVCQPQKDKLPVMIVKGQQTPRCGETTLVL